MLKQTAATALPHDSLLSRLFPWGSTLKRKRYETQGLNSLDIPLVKPSQQQEAGALLSKLRFAITLLTRGAFP